MSTNIISNIIFLPVILFIGCVTSYEDFTISKIRNKWILMGLLYAFAVYSVSWILYALAASEIISPVIGKVTSDLVWIFDKWCINLVISIIVAYLLWHFKMWGAGDAKLFICYSSLIPMAQYSKVYFDYYFASFWLLVAIFIPATIFFFVRSLAYLIKKITFRNIKETLPKMIKERLGKVNKIEIARTIFGFFVLFLFFRVLRQEFQNLLRGVLPNQNIVMLLPLLAFRPLSRIFKKNIKFTVIAFVFLTAYLIFKMLYSWERFIREISGTLGWVIFIMVLFPTVKKIINLYTERITQKTSPFAHWMFLGMLIVWFL